MEFREAEKSYPIGKLLLWYEVVRKTDRKVLGVTSGQRIEDKEETWWCNEDVMESVLRKRLVKGKWYSQRDKKGRQEYKET